MSNQDNLFKWWWSKNGPKTSDSISINHLEDLLGKVKNTNIVYGKDGAVLSDSGWNYAILRFIYEYCEPESKEESIFWIDLGKNKDPRGPANYSIWRKYQDELIKVKLLREKKYLLIFVNTEYSKIIKFIFTNNDISFKDISYANSQNSDILGDLTPYLNNYQSFLHRYSSVYPEMDKTQITIKSNEMFNFIKLQPDDIVVIADKTRAIIGIVKVAGIYNYNGQKEDFKHSIPIDLIDSKEREVPEFTHKKVGQTIIELSEEQYNEIISPNAKVSINLSENNYIFELLVLKKQIILYGPPGTGKTFNTKSIAINLIKCISGKDIFYEPKNIPILLSELEFNNPYFIEIQKIIENFPNAKQEKRKTMVGYYTVSKNTGNLIGLVWLDYPNKNTGYFKVHLRKEIDIEYPKSLISKLTNYKKNGWGGYPEIIIKNTDDVETAKLLINFAFENF